MQLESNLRHQALSADWLKHVDSVVTMGSATHIVVGSSRTSSKHGIGKKRARHSDIEPSSSSKTTGGLGMYWWRGGRLSRKLFNCKGLPRSFVTKAARQGLQIVLFSISLVVVVLFISIIILNLFGSLKFCSWVYKDTRYFIS